MTGEGFDHGAVLSISLSALVANWRQLAARAGGAACAGVVKADAYGVGIEVAVPALARAGCRTFFVAHLGEGERVRALEPEAIVYVLNGLAEGLEGRYAAARLRPVLGSDEEILAWRAAFPMLEAPAALHVDTGMNRLGLAPDRLGDWPTVLKPALIMSHFVSAETVGAPETTAQARRFASVRSLFQETPASLCNSSGLFADVESPIHHDLVRPGYALYGGNPTPGRANPMAEVVRLEAPILQVRAVKAGESVGYNGVWRAERTTRVAVLSLGYADGYLRAGSTAHGERRGHVLIEGVPCPVIGRVSMDLLTVDATAAPGARRGGRAVVIGDGLDVDTVGEALGTNGYEVLTGLGRRFQRRVIA